MNSKNKTKILLIGNDKLLLNTLSNILNNRNFFIKIAKKGIPSSKEALTNRYQIIIINVNSRTEIDEFTEKLKMFKSKGNKTPVIFVTHKLTQAEEIEIYQAGVNIIHEKPINPELFTVEINKLLNEHFIYTEINMKDIVLQPRRRKLFRNNKEIHLTRTEYDFLLLLIKNNGGVLNRDQIIRSIFKYTRDVNHCAVDTMVSRIRKKLGRENKKVIETVPGIGYRLSDEYIGNKNIFYK